MFGTRVRSEEAAGTVHTALLALQHRGQEGAGIAVLREGSILYHKDVGLVEEVFTPPVMEKLPHAHCAIGHVRYSTTGSSCRENVQPMVTEYFRGRIATAHNGNIVNAAALRERLREYGCDFAASNDSEVISSLIAYEALRRESIEEAVLAAAAQLRGAFSLVVLSSRDKLIALRDPWGFRPLCIGASEDGWAFASESCALDSTGFRFLRDVEPGELVSIGPDGKLESRRLPPAERMGLCVFEYVYFSRTDSVIDGLSVYEARRRMGEILAEEAPVEADLVCGVPDSGLEAAMGYAAASGIAYGAGFVKNRYVGRSFIFPSQSQRDAAVRLKLNPLRANVEGKRLVLIDDSLVRGTTSERIIRMLKQAGAREVHLRISSPPFLHACHFGTDVGDEDQLIAARMPVAAIAKEIGADSLAFISEQGLRRACSGVRLPLCTGCFSGVYPLTGQDLEGSASEPPPRGLNPLGFP